MTRQWRGVIEEYRDLLDIPDGVEAVTLREGGTPLVHSGWLSGLTGGEVHLKVEGDNPTGSFKDRGMTAAISVARHEGTEAVVCASTGNTSASMAAYAAKAGLNPLVLVPEGKIAAGKMAQAIVHGAQIIMVRGNFDHCLQMARGLSENYPVALVNSVNPVRLQGQKTASFEIVDFLGDAPDVHLLPVGNAGNISAYWLGYRQYADLGRATRTPGDAGVPGGRVPRRWSGRAVPRPGDQGHRDPGRQPRVVDARRRGPGRVRRPLRLGHRRPDPRRPARARLPATASSSSPRRPPASPGCCRTSSRASPTPASRVVVTVTGHGLKDTATALEGFGGLVDTVVDPDVDAAARAAGLTRLTADASSTGPVEVTRPGHLGQPRAGLRRARPGAGAARPADRRGHRRPDGRRGLRRGRRRRAARRDPPGVRAMHRGFDEMGERPPGLRLPCTQRDPARPRPGLLLGRDRGRHRPGPRPGRGRHAAARRRRGVPARRPARGPPRQRRPGLVRRLRGQRPRRPGRLLGGPVLGRPAGLGGRVRAADAAVDRGGPRLLPASVPHADAAANAGRAALLVTALAVAPSTCCSPPATCSTRTTGVRRCRPASTWSRRCAPEGPPAVVSGAGPTVLALLRGLRRRAAGRAGAEGWRALPLELDRAGVAHADPPRTRFVPRPPVSVLP